MKKKRKLVIMWNKRQKKIFTNSYDKHINKFKKMNKSKKQKIWNKLNQKGKLTIKETGMFSALNYDSYK